MRLLQVNRGQQAMTCLSACIAIISTDPNPVTVNTVRFQKFLLAKSACAVRKTLFCSEIKKSYKPQCLIQEGERFVFKNQDHDLQLLFTACTRTLFKGYCMYKNNF